MGAPWATGPQPQQPWGQQWVPPPAPAGPPPRPPRRPQNSAGLTGGVVALLLVAAAGGFVVGRVTAGDDRQSAERSAIAVAAGRPLEAAYRACTARDDGNTLSLRDGGTTIVIETRSEYGDPAGLHCVLGELDTPHAITAQMDRTTAMMGVQEAEDDGIVYSLTYHPDNGVDMVITSAGGN
ncbi:hypothetical protein [Candidatus Blastococcus massiliensis]|uniref:hypothetical protein n=1 Tax=Candidatus Blastococcus massiliensis TaxID=1470358 RepID=UPI00058D6694|nr:hypothetical protein [Candidatus Blastococcus massiliensis]